MLILSRKKNQSIVIDGDIKVVVLGRIGKHIQIGVEAPKHIAVYRQELLDKNNKIFMKDQAKEGKSWK